MKKPKEEEFKDLGFGTNVQGGGIRFLNKNGSFNVETKGIGGNWTKNIYHTLITMTWTRFNFLVLMIYLSLNLVFALLYLIAGVDNLDGVHGVSILSKFWDAFFFSAQTITTVGYGRISPVGFSTSTIAAIESLIGVLGFALATGLLYGRFSRPVAKILYSDIAIIAPYRDTIAFEFRLANGRINALIELEAELSFSRNEEVNGKITRSFHSLSLERKKITLLPTTWTIVHPIYEDSPLFGLTDEMLKQSDAEFIILIKAFDDSFSQTVYSRSSYKPDEIIWGAKFINLHERSKDKTSIDLNRLDAIEKVELPVMNRIEEAEVPLNN